MTRHGSDLAELSSLVAELETDSPAILDQLQDTQSRYDKLAQNVDNIVSQLESAHAEQSSYRYAFLDFIDIQIHCVQQPYLNGAFEGYIGFTWHASLSVLS